MLTRSLVVFYGKFRDTYINVYVSIGGRVLRVLLTFADKGEDRDRNY